MSDGTAVPGTGSYRRLVRDLREQREAIADAIADAVAAERAACAAVADRYKKFHLAKVISREIRARGTGGNR